jgi:hypothetical protein
MTNTTLQSVIDFLAANPGATAQEIGVTPVEMIRLEQEPDSPIVRVGQRKTGKRGRPPVEWALAGSVAPDAPTISDPEHDAILAQWDRIPNEIKPTFEFIHNEIMSGRRSDSEVIFLRKTRKLHWNPLSRRFNAPAITVEGGDE